jgi:rhodanese-related sulfurtransferase
VTRSCKDLVAEVIKIVKSVPAEEAAKLEGNSEVVFVAVREGEELQKTRTVQEAIHEPRGLLEFQADPTSPAHNPELGSGRRLVLYCAAGGNRYVLAARTLKETGIGLTVRGQEKSAAKAFVAFLQSPEGATIFRKWGWVTK